MNLEYGMSGNGRPFLFAYGSMWVRKTMANGICILGSGDDAVLASVAPGLFDNPVDPSLAKQFLADPRHHMAVAIEAGVVVAFASGVDYIHPDKPREFWINEVGVAPTHRGRGLGKAVLAALLEHVRGLGCREAWVLTDTDNPAANALYRSLGGNAASGVSCGYEFQFDLDPR